MGFCLRHVLTKIKERVGGSCREKGATFTESAVTDPWDRNANALTGFSEMLMAQKVCHEFSVWLQENSSFYCIQSDNPFCLSSFLFEGKMLSAVFDPVVLLFLMM